MTLAEYKKTPSWQGAINLTPGLIELAEELPAAEAMGLSLQLRQLMVALPAAIATDLIKGGETRFKPMFRLVAALELIDKVYPALDTSASRTAADALADQLTSDDFGQAQDTSAQKIPSIGAVPASPEPAAPADSEPEPVAEAQAPEPTHVQVQAQAPDVNGEDHVQPNRV